MLNFLSTYWLKNSILSLIWDAICVFSKFNQKYIRHLIITNHQIGNEIFSYTISSSPNENEIKVGM